MDNYGIINKYINNKIWFHKLFLNEVYFCQHCQQEIFNFYIYDQKHKSNNLNYNNHWDKNIIIEYDNKDNIMDYLNQNEGEFIFLLRVLMIKNLFIKKKILFF